MESPTKTEIRGPLSPYFNIDPDADLTALGAPATTDGFGSITQGCAVGRQDLASRGLEENGARNLGLFSREITATSSPWRQAIFAGC